MTARRRDTGYTLVEILVVLTIMALAMTAIPAIVAGGANVRLRAAADETVAALRMLHDQAIRRGTTTELVLDPVAMSYRMSTESGAHAYAKAVDMVAFEPEATVVRDPRQRVRFFPDGSATGGRIVLRHGDRTMSIVVDWLTGRARQP